MAYFSTWPHENRVSKTRFINLIKVKQEPTKKKKKKTRNRERRTQAARHARPRPGRTATQADRSRFFSLFVSGFFFFFFSGFFSNMLWAGRLSYLIWFFLTFIWLLCFWIIVIIIIIIIFLCILTCTRDLRVTIFLNFFWFINRVLDTRFPSRTKMSY